MLTKKKITFDKELASQLSELNQAYKGLSIHQRVEKLYEDFEGSDIMLT